VALTVASTAIGAYSLDVLHPVTLWQSRQEHAVLVDIRLPRIALALLVGSGLGIAGAALQGLFRNPLADPGLIGVTSGAALGAVLAIVTFGAALAGVGAFAQPIAALTGGALATLTVWRLARNGGAGVDPAVLLLSGIAINSLAGSVIGILTARSDDTQLRTLTFWLLGGLGGANWIEIGATSIPVAIGAAFLLGTGRALNAFAIGEPDARYLGVRTEAVKRRVIIGAAFAVGGAVAAAGAIAFVGLVTPHVVRLLFGPDHRLVLPASGLCGAFLLLLADVVARTTVAPAELPVGVVTALVGGPFFLFLLLKQKREITHV
jgi:iron complex transport system permease protein